MIAGILFNLILFAILLVATLGWFLTLDALALDWIIAEVIKAKLRKWANKHLNDN